MPSLPRRRRISWYTALPLVLAALPLADAAASEALLQKGGCISCHRVDQKLFGPALIDVANKYRQDTDAAAVLFEKVREGGEGVWGDVPMPPKSREQFSDEDLKIVIDWILQLR